MRSKKLLSMVTTLTLTASIFSGMSAYAALDFTKETGAREDFEGTIASSDTKVLKINDAQHGGVLKLVGKSAQLDYKFAKTNSGKYRLGFDMKKPDTDQFVLFAQRYETENDDWTQRSFISTSGTNLKLDTDGNWSFGAELATDVYAADKWSRIDLVFDYDEDWGECYVNGELKGEFDLSVYGIGGLQGMTFLQTDYSNNSCYTLLDNLEYVKVNGTEKLSPAVSADGQYLNIDFNVPVKSVTKDNFNVVKQDNPLAGAAAAEDFELEYADSTKAVLKLAKTGAAGTRYTVTLSDILSYQDAEPEKSSISATVPMEEIVKVVAERNMTDYTDETIFADDGVFTGTSSKVNVTENGAVITAPGKLNAFFPTIKAGVAEVEVTMSFDWDDSDSGEIIFTRISTTNATNEWQQYFLNQMHVANGMVFPTSSKIAEKAYVWSAKSYTKGTEFVMKAVYDPVTKKVALYKDGSLIVNQYPWITDGPQDGNTITGTRGVEFEAVKGGAKITVKKIKATQRYTPVPIGDVTFVDAIGGETPVTAVSSATKQIKISFPEGLLNDTFSGEITLKKDGTDVDFTGSYDAETKIYTMNLKKLLGVNETYTMKISGGTSSDGKVYAGAEGTFTTGEGVTDFKLNAITKTATGVNVNLGCINTDSDVSYYVIWAGYQGGKMVKMDYKPLNVEKDSSETVRNISFESTEAASCDKLSAFIWKGFDKITPVTPSIDG